MLDVETKIRAYAKSLDERYPDVSPAEILDRDRFVEEYRLSAGHGHRPRFLVALVAAILVLVAFAVLQRPPDRLSTAAQPGPTADLGIFEAVRGRIVYVTDAMLSAVDPERPDDVVAIELPDLTQAAGAGWADNLVPVGWAADGAILAMRNEDRGTSYLFDRAGQMTPIEWEKTGTGIDGGGCCGFVDSNWLSPSGAMATISRGSDVLIVDLRTHTVQAHFDLADRLPEDPFSAAGVSGSTWSPDGSQLAIIISQVDDEGGTDAQVDGEHVVWSLLVGEVGGGEVRELSGPVFGRIRTVAWSPDGSQLLVVAGDLPEVVLSKDPPWNPTASPLPASLYLLDVTGAPPREIADGSYVAAVWSPDGTEIAAIDYPGNRNLVVMSDDGTAKRTVVELSAQPPFTGLAWHPLP
jgi:WD40 repeat protein